MGLDLQKAYQNSSNLIELLPSSIITLWVTNSGTVSIINLNTNIVSNDGPNAIVLFIKVPGLQIMVHHEAFKAETELLLVL